MVLFLAYCTQFGYNINIEGRCILMKTIKELRETTGLSQSQFAKKYKIPIKTLQHWECGDNNPAPYLINLLENEIGKNIITIKGYDKKNDTRYYYNPDRNTVADKYGNTISLKIDLDATSKHNLGLYLDTLFDKYYSAKNDFNSNLNLSKNSEEKIEWERLS